MKYCQLVMGSAGTGKSTYCHALQEHCATKGRTVRVANLDPAAEHFKYDVAFDIRDLVSVDDVMTEMGLGPNGSLIFCMEYLLEDDSGWFAEQLEGYMEDDYLLIDCPGQIELYSHIPVFKKVAHMLQARGFNVCVVYCVDSLFVTDAAKLIAGNLTALAAMVHLELPHINLLTKCDLVDKGALERYLAPSGDALAGELARATGPRFKALNKAIARILDDYDMVSFIPCDITDEEGLEAVLLQVDHAIQYGEDMEPREPHDDSEEADDRLSRMREMQAQGGVGEGIGGSGSNAAAYYG